MDSKVNKTKFKKQELNNKNKQLNYKTYSIDLKLKNLPKTALFIYILYIYL